MSTSESNAKSARKLRILCLHGYHGSGDALRAQMAPLLATFEPFAELVFLDAPSLAAGDYGWWHAVNVESDPASDDPGVDGPRRHYKGWTRTRDALVAAFEAKGPFDGVFGFSQGAALTGLLVGLRAPDGRPSAERALRFDFAMIVSGFPARDPELARLYAREDSYALPSLHLFGRSDGIVPEEDSRALAAHFANPVLVEHGGGHVVAGGAAVRASVSAFLAERVRARDGTEQSAEPRASITVSLWGSAPSSTMRVVFPAKPRGARSPALVVFRGGAYATNGGSGGGAAEWAAENGMVGVEVAYRMMGSGDAYPKNFADAARAIRMVRSRACEWGVDAERVGVLGFSAGGHLASLIATQPESFVDPADDLAASVPARPSFAILAYPLISFVEGYAPGAFASSTENFFGRRDPTEADRRRFSTELHVTRDTPPMFVWTTAEDELVPAAHSRVFAESCKRAGVPVILRVYPHGPHALGLARGDRRDVGRWTEEALSWMRSRKILDS